MDKDAEGIRYSAISRTPVAPERRPGRYYVGNPCYRSKMHPVLKRNFEVFSDGAWLAALTAHIPNAGEDLVRYYGWYSNVSRGKQRTAQGEGEAPANIEEFSEIPASTAKRAWARLIKPVYEADPLVCPRCGGAMRILAFIEQPEVIDLPVPGTCLRLPVAFATQTGADTHRQAADREDPDPPRDLACPSPQSAGTLHGRVIRSPAPVRSAAASGNPAAAGATRCASASDVLHPPFC